MLNQLSRQESVQTQASAAEPGPKEAQPDPLQDADSLPSTVDLGAVFIPQAAVSAEQLPFPTWERYKILSLLGSGGMGAVYKARDLRLNRYIAIKFLRGSQADALDQRQRRHFEREARAQARIEHPNICKIPGGCRNSNGIA